MISLRSLLTCFFVTGYLFCAAVRLRRLVSFACRRLATAMTVAAVSLAFQIGVRALRFKEEPYTTSFQAPLSNQSYFDARHVLVSMRTRIQIK
ncbi:hypothetical protein C8R45DRAFT_194367 [Mycena sanguinolenta]|nr:hypothetical protein C8R45DRAFT_194367 [Mycena sanguinolenta]